MAFTGWEYIVGAGAIYAGLWVTGKILKLIWIGVNRGYQYFVNRHYTFISFHRDSQMEFTNLARFLNQRQSLFQSSRKVHHVQVYSGVGNTQEVLAIPELHRFVKITRPDQSVWWVKTRVANGSIVGFTICFRNCDTQLNLYNVCSTITIV